MTLRQFRLAARRWGWLIVAGALIGVVVGWASAPDASSIPASMFQATHTMLPVRKVSSGAEGIRVSKVLATLGPVPDRVAARLRIDPKLVRSMVSAETAPSGVLSITGRSADRVQAEQLANLTAEELIIELGGEKSPLRTLEPAVAAPVKSEEIEAPTSRRGRAMVLGAFGVVLGVGAAVWVHRFDTRIRSKETAEGATGARILAEVPSISRSNRDRLLTGERASPVVEAYRALRTSVDLWSTRTGSADAGRVVVVTSPTGGEGTTTTVAHLAVTWGEFGRSVVAISADLRNPRLHLHFERPREPGLSDVLRGAPDARRLIDLALSTTIRGVRFVSSGAPVRNPAPLLDRIGDHLREARDMADLVLIDAPPLLTTSDGADLALQADGVLLVVRAGRTSVGAARRSAELLERLGIPVLGVVLVGSDRSAT